MIPEQPQAVVLLTTVMYLGVVVGIGEYARRRTAQTREGFLMASRSFGTVVLFFALLATNMTSFVLLGAPGLAYEAGIGAFGYIVGLPTLVLPLLLGTVGYRFWLAGQRFGHVTPGQLFAHRLDSPRLGVFVMGLMTVWTVPYLLLAAVGSGIAFDVLTDGTVPYWLGAAIPLVVVFVYVTAGGMRATGWTNVFQGLVFILFLWVLLVALVVQFGGPRGATAATAASAPEHLTRDGPPQFGTRTWLSFAVVISINAIMYPHILRRLMTALDATAIRRLLILYPVGLLVTWTPAVLLGFWGAGQVDGLTGTEVDTILPVLVVEHTSPVFAGLALAGILAAIMSSLDAQTLSVSTMLSQDLLREHTTMPDRHEVLVTRGLIALLLAVTFVLALVQPDTIVGIAEFAFSGYALLFFPLVVSLYWRGATSTAAWVGLAWGFAGLLAFQAGLLPGWLTAGFMPFVPVAVSQILVTAAVGLVTETPPTAVVDAYFELYDGPS